MPFLGAGGNTRGVVGGPILSTYHFGKFTGIKTPTRPGRVKNRMGDRKFPYSRPSVRVKNHRKISGKSRYLVSAAIVG